MIRSIIDISHWDAPVDFQEVAKAPMVAVIAKATQGAGVVDPAYGGFKKDAAPNKLLWGSYHFGTGDDVAGQVSHYLETANPGPDEVVCLDLEENPNGTTMSLEQAREFVRLMREKLGRWPVLYGGHYLKDALGSESDSVLAKCPLWIAQYASKPVLPPGWKKYTLWQYTDGTAGPLPHKVRGVGPCDRNQFNGTVASLRERWPFANG